MSDTEQALSSSVLALDASRRVGWAKAYAAAEQIDSMSREVNLFRGDRDAYRAGASLLYGILRGYTTDTLVETAQRLLDETLDGYDLVTDSVLVARGLRIGRSVKKAQEKQDAFEHERAADRQRWRKENRYAERRARDLLIDDLCLRYGLEDESEIHKALGAWQVKRQSSKDLGPVRGQPESRLVELCAAIVLNADDAGVCSRELLRRMYADAWEGANTEKHAARDGLSMDSRTRNRAAVYRNQRGMQWSSAKYKGKGSSEGRKSSRLLSDDLQLLEKWGLIIRDADYVTVRDYKLITEFMRRPARKRSDNWPPETGDGK